ncbi:MAG TPA: cytochrome c [Phaeodactylibacter sp.]|nr:cytochrome c [Phaeodactylibacter sp.]
MKKSVLIFLSIISFILFASLGKTSHPLVKASDRVAMVLEKLGDDISANKANLQVKGASAERGRDLVLKGITKKPNGRKTKKQSRHFVCTSCHNIKKEDPDLSIADPQARLEYVNKNGMRFLQGTTLYGAVNRTSFYNGDYYKKYGKLVYKARNNIREAIQLCATECAQGRRLKSWELESILAYLWTIDLKMEDLNLSTKDFQTIEKSLANNNNSNTSIQLIKSKYLSGSPATFVAPPKDRKLGYQLKAHPENGKLIYELSCLHCHKNGRYSFFKLDESKNSLKYLTKHFPEYSRYSVYQVARYGTPPVGGKKSYMPQYTLEKMSNQQMEDLRAYIEQRE